MFYYSAMFYTRPCYLYSAMFYTRPCFMHSQAQTPLQPGSDTAQPGSDTAFPTLFHAFPCFSQVPCFFYLCFPSVHTLGTPLYTPWGTPSMPLAYEPTCCTGVSKVRSRHEISLRFGYTNFWVSMTAKSVYPLDAFIRRRVITSALTN